LITGLVFLLDARATDAHRTNPLVVFPSGPEALPAIRYANLDADSCRSELGSRGIPFGKAENFSAINAPVTLEGKLHDVAFEFRWSPDETHRDVLDCRLLLALDDLARIAGEQQIAIVRYNSIYRPGWARRRLQGHAGGVAIDITELVKRDGTVLNVRKDFAGERIGSATCGERAKPPKVGKASDLRRLICSLDRARVFNLLLTPHYDRRHSNHFHFEVRRGISWFLTQ
jgi:hypothetical protein